jgi:hypothetical protein
MEPHWPAVSATAALRCSTLAVALRSSSFQVRSISLLFSIPRALFSCLSLVYSSCLPLRPFPPLCSPPTLFRFPFLRSCYKQRFARSCGLSLASAPAPADPLSPIRSLRRRIPRPGLLSRRRQSAGLLQRWRRACVGPALRSATESPICRYASGGIVLSLNS